MRASIRNQSAAVELLKKLVTASSPTSDQGKVRAAHSIVADELARAQFQIRWHRDHSGQTDDLLVAERASKSNPKHFITFVSHVDTVLDENAAGAFRVSHHDGLPVAYGAGVIDNKGGLVVLIESLKTYLKLNPDPPIGLRVVSSPNEEAGSSPWHEHFRELGRQSSAVLGFEPAYEDGSIIKSRRGNRWYDVKIRGVEAHAGRCRGEEINAAHEAANLIQRAILGVDALRTQRRTQVGEGVSLHVGHIEGGRNCHNIVCGAVTLKLDTRFSNFEERDALHSHLIDIFEKPLLINRDSQKPEITYSIVDDCPPFDENASGRHLIETLTKDLSGLEGRRVMAVKAGGAGDVNHMSRPGLFVVDGLGPVGGRMHTVDEFIELQSLESRITALSNWYSQVAQFALANLEV